MSIENYLYSKYKVKTAQSYFREWQDFERFIEGLNLLIEAVDYPLLLEYVRHLRSRKLKGTSINRKLLIIEQVFSYLLPNNNRLRGFRVKTEGRR